ncbi:MAG: STAS domain-containing protein [Actinomycetota bacterium]|nr:STAS domain-containing protein [Actinomycetota bacterium]
MSELVQLRFETRDEVVVARVGGELDLSGAPTTGQAITDAVPASVRGLVVDCSSLQFIDSSGVSMLFDLRRQLGSRRQELRVVAAAAGPVARVLEIVEFQRAAPVDETLEEALSAMGAGEG